MGILNVTVAVVVVTNKMGRSVVMVAEMDMNMKMYTIQIAARTIRIKKSMKITKIMALRMKYPRERLEKVWTM